MENEKLAEQLRKINVDYDLSPRIHATITEAAAALTAAEARIKMLSEALDEIAGQDIIEIALDPNWPSRIAEAALAKAAPTPSPDPEQPETSGERVRLARMIEAMVKESPWAASADSRMALAIAASNVRRGRPLTSAEKFENLCAAIGEDDPALADHLRSKVRTPGLAALSEKDR